MYSSQTYPNSLLEAIITFFLHCSNVLQQEQLVVLTPALTSVLLLEDKMNVSAPWDFNWLPTVTQLVKVSYASSIQ